MGAEVVTLKAWVKTLAEGVSARANAE